MIPDEGISGPYYVPLYIGAALYLILMVTGFFLSKRGAGERATQLKDLSFGLVLVTAAYVGVLFIVAVTSEYDLIWDMLRIIGIIVAFFALLIVLMLVVFELGVGALSRRRR